MLPGKFNLPHEEQLFTMAHSFLQPHLQQCGVALAALPASPWKEQLLQLDECVTELWSWEKMLSPCGSAAAGRAG